MGGFANKTVMACVLWLALAAPALADVRGLLAEVLAAHGGGAAPTAIHERGVIETLRRGNGVVERWWQAPDRFRIEIGYPADTESRLLRGNEAWQQGEPATAAFHGSLVLQAAREPATAAFTVRWCCRRHAWRCPGACRKTRAA